MAGVNSSWVTAHGKLWYDDKWYRMAWIVWPQALAAVVVLWFWAMPSGSKNAKWAVPLDPTKRYDQLIALRDAAKTNQSSMDRLEKDASGGEAVAQFFYATLFDPDLKLSTIAQPDAVKAIGWYARGAAQGEQMSTTNVALLYFTGTFVRQDYTRACGYARNIAANGHPPGLRIKGDCYARGLGGTTVDLVQAANAYQQAADKGHGRAMASLGYFYENGLGGRSRSPETALKYYRAAADKSDSLGLHNLGAAYNSGLLGLQRDANESSRLIIRALENKYDVTVQSLTTHPEVWTFEFWQYLQRRLAEKGYYSGAVDGRANPATLDAVRRLGR